jgi:hypothetical protein
VCQDNLHLLLDNLISGVIMLEIIISCSAGDFYSFEMLFSDSAH